MKYKEMIQDTAETVLGFLALVESKPIMTREITDEGNGDGEELKEQRTRDIETEIL